MGQWERNDSTESGLSIIVVEYVGKEGFTGIRSSVLTAIQSTLLKII
jgi:hypothetical protein